MKPKSLVLLLALAAAPASVLAANVTDPDAPRSVAGDTVSVSWADPSSFSDLRYSGNRWAAAQGDWVNQLAQYLQKRAAARLPEGARMEVTITDVQRAGRYEPWLGMQYDQVRIMRDTYPPRMKLDVRITGADGQVLAEGERKLQDTGYLQRTATNDSDVLRYEKRMIDDWLRRELPPAGCYPRRPGRRSPGAAPGR